jgi:DNA-binding LacI/PurR family transcriptional regulator
MNLPRAVVVGTERRAADLSTAQYSCEPGSVRLAELARQARAAGPSSSNTPPLEISPALARRLPIGMPSCETPAPLVAILRLQSHKIISRETARAHGRSMLGALERARHRGLRTRILDIGEKTCPWRNVAGLLARHGVRGAIILAEDRTDLPKPTELRSLHVVSIGPQARKQGLPWVSVDHDKAIWHAIRHMAQAGFARPGLMLRSSHSKETRRRWETAFSKIVRMEMAGQAALPPLIYDFGAPDNFARWMRDHQFDVVLTTSDVRPRQEGSLRPQLTFVALDAAAEIAACAGIDQCHEQLGAKAVDLIAEALPNKHRLEATGTLLPPLWLEASDPQRVSRTARFSPSIFAHTPGM